MLKVANIINHKKLTNLAINASIHDFSRPLFSFVKKLRKFGQILGKYFHDCLATLKSKQKKTEKNEVGLNLLFQIII